MIGRNLFACLMLAAASAHGASCTFTSLPSLNFGPYDPYAAIPLDIATSATIRCTTTVGGFGERITITSSIDRGGAPSFNPRQMRNAQNNTLNYNLFTNTTRTTIFGDGTSGTSAPSVPNTRVRINAPVTLTVNIFGRVFAGQDPSVGVYSDTLTYTVTF